jgi:hypothetical protein
MGVGQRWPQAAGTADRNGGVRPTRVWGGGSGLAVFNLGGLFCLHVMNNYYFISTNPRTKTRKKKLERVGNPGKIFKHTTGVLKLQNS